MEENYLYAMLNAPRLWYRKVDDTFAITLHDLGETLQKLNNIDKKIEFTMEKSSEGNLFEVIKHYQTKRYHILKNHAIEWVSMKHY